MYYVTDDNDISLDFDDMCDGMNFGGNTDVNLDIYDDIAIEMNDSDRLEAVEDMVA